MHITKAVIGVIVLFFLFTGCTAVVHHPKRFRYRHRTKVHLIAPVPVIKIHPVHVRYR